MEKCINNRPNSGRARHTTTRNSIQMPRGHFPKRTIECNDIKGKAWMQNAGVSEHNDSENRDVTIRKNKAGGHATMMNMPLPQDTLIEMCRIRSIRTSRTDPKDVGSDPDHQSRLPRRRPSDKPNGRDHPPRHPEPAPQRSSGGLSPSRNGRHRTRRHPSGDSNGREYSLHYPEPASRHGLGGPDPNANGRDQIHQRRLGDTNDEEYPFHQSYQYILRNGAIHTSSSHYDPGLDLQAAGYEGVAETDGWGYSH